MRPRHRLSVLLAAVALLAAGGGPVPSTAAVDGWSPLQEAGGNALAVALDAGSTAVISTGGEDDATVYDQRRAADGTLTTPVPVMTVDDAEDCRPVEAAASLGDLAVAVECRAATGLEDPPTRLAELVWTADDGWTWRVLPEAGIGSVDWSPEGQYVVFATNSSYGRPHHVTSHHADLGWRDLTRRELGPTGDSMVAAIGDDGDVVALRGAGFEAEPGYWWGGVLRVEHYDDRSGTWRRTATRRYPDGGIAPRTVDLVDGRIAATAVRSRSTGSLRGREDTVLVVSGRPRAPRVWSPRRWSRDVLAASAAATPDGVAVASWQTVGRNRTAVPWLATWAPGRRAPVVRALPGGTTLTAGAQTGGAMDLSAAGDGHVALAWVARRQGSDTETVTASSFRVGPRGGLRDRLDTSWPQPADTTVEVVASEGAASLTMGRVQPTFLRLPLVHYTVLQRTPAVTGP